MHGALDDRLHAAVTDARNAIDSLLFDRRLRNVDPAAITGLRNEAGAASAALDGADAPLDDSPMGRMISAHQAAVSECSKLVDVVTTAPAQALAQLHLVASAWRDIDENLRGRPRSSADFDDPLHLGVRTTAEEARIFLFDATRLFTHSSDIPALVLAARIHALLAIHAPFATDSTVVARAAGRLMMMSRGVDPDGLIPLESGLLKIGRPAYVKTLREFAQGNDAHWIVLHAQAAGEGAAIAKQRLL